MIRRRRSAGARAVAAALLAAVALWFVAPAAAAVTPVSHGCPTPSPGVDAPALAPATPGGSCHQLGDAGCPAMLGCVAPPTVLQPGRLELPRTGPEIGLAPIRRAAIPAQLGLGPPTPPPNS